MQASPRVLFLDQAGELGGAELSLLDLARHRGDRCKVLLFADGPFRGRLQTAGVQVEIAHGAEAFMRVGRNSGAWPALKAAPHLARLAFRVASEARGYDVVYANTQKAFMVGALAAAIARKPMVWHLRDMLTANHFSPVLRMAAVGVANRMATGVIANSEATARAFIQAGGAAARTSVIYNGVDVATFDTVDAAAARRALREQLGCGEAPVVGLFGRFAPWKGQHVVLDALGRHPDVHVVMVGGPLFGEELYEARVRKIVADRGLEKRVHFLGFREEVPDLMKAVDIIVHASIAPEPFGRVIVEGMLAGRPVVATAAGGALEIIEDGVTGLLVPPDDAAALGRALGRLMDDPAFARRLGSHGRAAAIEKFSLSANLAAVDRAIRGFAPGAA
jgi:glycosyltransferase involved in cell wall biosynthesis